MTFRQVIHLPRSRVRQETLGAFQASEFICQFLRKILSKWKSATLLRIFAKPSTRGGGFAIYNHSPQERDSKTALVRNRKTENIPAGE